MMVKELIYLKRDDEQGQHDVAVKPSTCCSAGETDC